MRAFACLVALWVAACGKPGSSTCANGAVCPPGLQCATFEGGAICILATCGDGVLDHGESCDDGNNLSGDGCSADCSEPCGNGVVDPGELCDDSNRDDGDGCAADCRRLEACGNGIVDLPEGCDDGNTRSHDGCSSACSEERSTWYSLDAGAPAALSPGAFDSQRGVLVVLAANDATVRAWEWDGGFWRDRGAVPGLSSNVVGPLAYDSGRRRVVLQDTEGTTWEWDGVVWTAKRLVVAPRLLVAPTMTYDRAREQVVLLGSRMNMVSEMWSWDGATWKQIEVALPPPRFSAAMTYDAARERIVLTGGTDGAVLGDAWQWNGTAWTELVTDPMMGSRYGHGMAYDEARGVVLVVGGTGFGGEMFREVWELEGTTWRRGRAMQEGRMPGSLVYDPQRSVVWMAGGKRYWSPLDDGLATDVMRYDGERWTPVTKRTPTTPFEPAGSERGLFYDPVTEELVAYDPRVTWRWDRQQWWFEDRTHPELDIVETVAFGASWLAFGDRGDTLGETWIYSNQYWTKYADATVPARFRPALAYDPERQRVVMFGGALRSMIAPPEPTDRTFEWSPAMGWVERTPATKPSPRVDGVLVFDPVRRTVLLFGGVGVAGQPIGEQHMWEWNGTDWAPLAATPPLRAGRPSVIADPVRQRVVLFGGVGTNNRTTDETWEWDGASWTQRQPTRSPPPGHNHGVAFDASINRVVLFGGNRQPDLTASREMWTWDGSEWTEVTDLYRRPVHRTGHAMVYDAARDETLLFGGMHLGLAVGDTWTWTREGWREHRGSAGPPARVDPAIAYDPIRERVVMFGGSSTEQRFNDTWEWDGEAWHERTPATSPVVNFAVTPMTFDGTRGTMMLFGDDGEQWEWNGTTWSRVGTVPNPPSLLAYDSARNVVVGMGRGLDGDRLLEWNGTAWTMRAEGNGPQGPMESRAMVFEPLRGRTVVVGSVPPAVWEWDGVTWRSGFAPVDCTMCEASIEPTTGAVVMFGGIGATEPTAQNVYLQRYEDLAYPDEVCRADAGDIDLDGVAHCDDADCATVCEGP